MSRIKRAKQRAAAAPELVKPGECMTALDVDESARLAKLAIVQDACWLSAVRALKLLPAGAVYVEGWIAAGGWILEHGWCELEGRIIDLTLYNHPDQPAKYFPGIRYTPERIFKFIDSPRCHLPAVWALYGRGPITHADYGRVHNLAVIHGHRPILWMLYPLGGIDHPGYIAAYRAAQRTVT